ncbi:MAG: hypothetical protein RTU92_02635 [Candidatus Thorarchaeota archaeon]
MWDYSGIPERKWQWTFVEDHWMDLVIDEAGLTYIGTDWTCQSGGGYFGGFQTFEEFFKKGPIQKMPKKIAKEVSEYLKEYRKEGGSRLRLVYVHEVEGFLLTGVFVHFDDNPIHVKSVKEKGEMLIYDGSIVAGEHTISFVFVLNSADDQEKVTGEVKIKIQDGYNDAVLKTTVDESGELQTELIVDGI